MPIYYHVTLHDFEHPNESTYWVSESYIDAKKLFLAIHKEHPISIIEFFACIGAIHIPISIYP